MATPVSSPSPSTAGGAGYFVDQKKGEVNELKQLLKNINIERDINKKRDIIKKVIAYMTLGIDVSRLFTDMIMAIETRDMVIKKLVYFYLTHYARKQPELAIMCINTLRRDCENEDPMVRGLALRSLCGLGLESVVEYIENPLKKSFTDVSPYVRRTAVMGVLKIFALSPEFVEHGGYLSTLEGMISDIDASVTTNVLMVLEELKLSSGGIEPTTELIMHLLNRLGEFNEWGLNIVLDILSRYCPKSDDETFAIMNILDPVLRTSNSGAVLATTKCFLTLTEPYPDLIVQVIQRSKAPLLTLLASSTSEIQYAILKHLESLLPRSIAKGIFDDEYKLFFVRYNEPPHVKHLKIDLIRYIANQSNAREIATELSEYVTDVDSELSKKAIRALGEIALRVSDVSSEMTQRIVELVDLDMAYVRSEALIVLGNVVRIYPSMRIHILPFISRYLKKVEDSDARAVLIWLLGEYGEEVIEAPYLLEPIIDEYPEEHSTTVKLHTLSAAIKLFFKRPPEMQAMLGRILSVAVNDTSNQDIHDRALLYYRLLSTNVDGAAQIFQRHSDDSNSQSNDGFDQGADIETLDRVFKEFNTLSAIYGKPCVHFIDEKYLLNSEATDAKKKERVQRVLNANPVQAYSNPSPNQTIQHSTPVVSSLAAVVAAPKASVNLLDWDDEPQPPVHHQHHHAAHSGFKLGNIELAPPEFQHRWGALSEILGNKKVFTLAMVPDATSEVESAMRDVKINTMASGALSSPPGMKFFFYAKEDDDVLRNTTGNLFLVQMVIINSSGDVSVTLKSSTQDQKISTLFIETLKGGLAEFSPSYAS